VSSSLDAREEWNPSGLYGRNTGNYPITLGSSLTLHMDKEAIHTTQS
jgi:hypothetical protein